MTTPTSATFSPKPTIRRATNNSNSSSSSRKSVGRAVNPNIVYEYALRCAIRAHMEQTDKKQDSTSSAMTSHHSSGSVSKKKEERHLSLHHSFSSLNDKFSNEDNKKSGKLTREIVKSLSKRLEDVYKERDVSQPEFMDQRFRTVAKAVKKGLQEHRYRPSGTVNDIVVSFLKTSEAELRMNQPNPALWYDDLNRFLARFVDMVIQTLQKDAPSSATPELIDSLSAFCTPTQKTTLPEKRSSNSSNASSLSTSSTAVNQDNSILEFPMIMTIKHLFHMSDKEHQQKVMELASVCTESALLHDFKKCINNVHTNQPFPGKREDFPSSQAYENWQKKEVKQLTELMKTLMLMNPNLSIATSSEQDVGNTNLLARQSTDSFASISSSASSTVNVADASSFTFIPADPKGCFRYLMSMCLDHDTDNLSTLPEAERAKTSALSQQSDELLRECWKTWRLSAPFRAILYLSLVKSKFDSNELGLDDINDALRSLERVAKENDASCWAIADRTSIIRVLEGVDNSLLRDLADGLSEYWKISPTWVQDIVDLLEKVYSNAIYAEAHPNPEDNMTQLEDSIKGAAVERWSSIERTANDPEKDALSNLFSMADILSKELTSVAKKRFPHPIMGVLSVSSLVMARQMPYFALEMENWAYSPDFKACPIDSAFALYEKVLRLEKLYDEYGPETKKSLFKVESWFLPHVKRWLTKTNESTFDWVENAVAQDQFQRYSDVVVHSSSIIDLFSMFNQAVDFIVNLQWPNDVQHCLFMTFLAKIIGEGIDHYCRTMEDLIRADVFPNRLSSQDLSSESVVSGSILDKARYQIMGGRGLNKDEACAPSNFITPELCIKLNDIEAARGKLDRLYQMMHVDQVAQFMRENTTPQSTYRPEKNNFLYSIRVVRAENLQPMDNNGLSDPYVTFEIDGKMITRTRTVYETLNPRWDQEFDIWLSEDDVDVCVIVNDEDVITADEECGAAWFTLSPKFSELYQKDDLVLHLSPQGSLVLRVNIESEKNDIQFWFGKAFRTLKTSDMDAAWLIVDKMTPYIRHCLSRQVIDKLLGRDKSGFFSAFSRVASKQTEPDLQACEDAIAPLLDFLEHNLAMLNENLTETIMQSVVLKIWKQILRTLDSILLPPLSEHLSEVKPLDDYQLHVVLKWLELLKILFNGGEDGDAIPLESLENAQYYSLIAINSAYRLDTLELMQSYQLSKREPRSSLNISKKPANRSKTVYHSKNTIRQSKSTEKREHHRRSSVADMPHGDDILRILRMRKDRQVVEFLRQEFENRNSRPSSKHHTTDSEHTVLPETPTSLKDMSVPPTLPAHGITLTD
ncbi:hypothetical protein V8B55DRAFT_1512014 [Mucor lusitanicus]|uniref:C2 domain-containing protein n=2 Tax=Mucor circinelloides f. lusitanicus TaxID=29924 RepID=A0A168GS53_MUCCL|nr:hypothetical protein FB192DRAFT_1457316 [Mucor lusitanicus]OAC97970.1 hypothetical protein MUCCIDRAFT_86692 [Mucor lusitanicus CBS 277.49]